MFSSSFGNQEENTSYCCKIKNKKKNKKQDCSSLICNGYKSRSGFNGFELGFLILSWTVSLTAILIVIFKG